MTNHKNEFAFGRICILLNELEFGLLRLQVSCNEQTSQTCTFSFDQFQFGQKFENNSIYVHHGAFESSQPDKIHEFWFKWIIQKKNKIAYNIWSLVESKPDLRLEK